MCIRDRGNAYKRFKALKALEDSGATVSFTDYTTGEKLEVYVEEVAYNRTASPSIGTKRHGSGWCCPYLAKDCVMSPNEVAGLVLTVLTIMGILLGALGWWINTKIKAATYQIQPSTNGGKSLSDLHKKVDRLSTDVDLIKSAVLQLEEDVEQLEHDVEDLK